jgi:hypothetical protein
MVDETVKSAYSIPVRLLATTPEGDVPVEAENTTLHLPADPHCPSQLCYGPYLGAIHSLLRRNKYQELLDALSSRLGCSVTRESIDLIDIRSEKHGACYHVARVDVRVAGELVSFVVNVAASPEEETQLEREFNLLKKLSPLYNYSFLPHVYFKGAGRYQEKGKPIKWLRMFVGEWFSGFHEFHLHRDQLTASNRLRVWDLHERSYYLSEPESLELYRQAAKILTLYYDWNSSKQIYPWHHAAGDFILRKQDNQLAIRLVTVRDYRSLVGFETENKTAKLLALFLFFLHLTFQLRLDRLDGVGAVTWAEDYSLQGIVNGFFQGLGQGRNQHNARIPPTSELKEIVSSFTKDEWLQLLVEMLATYSFAHEEVTIIRDHGDIHLATLQRALASKSLVT